MDFSEAGELLISLGPELVPDWGCNRPLCSRLCSRNYPRQIRFPWQAVCHYYHSHCSCDNRGNALCLALAANTRFCLSKPGACLLAWVYSSALFCRTHSLGSARFKTDESKDPWFYTVGSSRRLDLGNNIDRRLVDNKRGLIRVVSPLSVVHPHTNVLVVGVMPL